MEILPVTGEHIYDEGVITAEATCGESGEKIFTCTICGKQRIAILPMIREHCYDEGKIWEEPTCTEGGSMIYTCILCGKTKAEGISATGHALSYAAEEREYHGTCTRCGYTCTESHSFAGGICICGAQSISVDERVRIGHSLDLTSDITMNFTVREDFLESYSHYYLECKVPIYEGNAFVGTKTVILEPELRKGYYYFVLEGLISLEMNNVVESQLHMSREGEVFVSAVDRYSIATYAYNQLKDAQRPVALKRLCADLLQYGAKAQLWKGYRTDALADEAMTEEHRAFLTDPESVTFIDNKKVFSDHPDPTVPIVGTPLSLDTRIVIRYVIDTTAYTGNEEDLSLHMTYLGIDGTEKTLILEDPEIYYEPYHYYAFRFDGLLASELRAVMRVTVYEGENPVSETMEYSVDSYGVGKTGAVRTVMQAMIAYSDSAKAFFS